MNLLENKLNDLDILNKIVDKGKTGLAALGLYLVYRLIDKSMEKGYNFSADLKNLHFEFVK